ncbi:MAG: hypothetical protein RIG63_03120 [Coleofasciculus chthonoplastes F3-SA18-01]|uniref:hypothetical protein n=1 Tax=Coleofasciculus chthonoplastes TaxID=64178 RepID=UPI0032F220F5
MISAKVGAGLVTSRCNRKDNSETRPYTITRHVRQALPSIYAMKTQAIAPEYSFQGLPHLVFFDVLRKDRRLPFFRDPFL